MKKRFSLAAALVCALTLAAPLCAEIQVLLQEGAQGWLRTDSAVAFEVEGPVDGRLAVFLGATDVTDLFQRRGATWVYRPELLPLPSGEEELTVWLVAETGWQELGRLPLKVLRRSGLEQQETQLRLDLQGLADVSSGGSQPPPEEERLTAQIDLQQRAARSGFELRLVANLVGVSQEEQALRFAEKGEDADRLDLSSWSLEVGKAGYELGLGHVSFGDSRHLIQGFNSRGARLRLPLGRPVELSLAAVNGSSVVGWDNFLGLQRSEHQILAGTLGIEVLPARPGGLRLEATLLDGSLLPLSGFNQGFVTDREESEGWSARVVTATPGSRFRLDAGAAESRFTNPLDPSLAQGAALVSTESETRGARYADLSWVLLRREGAKKRPVELSMDARHQRVEPQYRTVAAFVQADREENGADLRLAWGGVLGQLSWSAGRDNLDDVPSILTTRTRRGAWSLALPFAQLTGGDAPSPWLPTFSLTGQRIHQKGDELPLDGGFSESHIPDQMSWNHQLNLQWGGGGWSLGASAVLSEQDNRQAGREAADFTQRGLGLTFMTAPWERLDLGVDLRQEEQDNGELGEVTEVRTSGLTWTLRLPARNVVTGNVSWSESKTDPGIRESEDLVGDAQWAWGFEGRRQTHGFSGQIYLRWAYQRSDATDFQFAFADFRTGWKLTAGLTMSLF